MKITFHGFDGYVHGAIQPSAAIGFEFTKQDILPYKNRLIDIIRELPRKDQLDFQKKNTDCVGVKAFPYLTIRFLDYLNAFCGDQRFTKINVFQRNGVITFVLPTLSPFLVRSNLNSLFRLLKSQAPDSVSGALDKLREDCKISVRKFLPAGTNAGSFIAAAADRKIPFKILSPRFLIFGYGHGASIFNSSITERDSSIGVALAKSKVDTNRLLRMSGFPVTEQAIVRDLSEALRQAETLGYPVVLKPENEDGGRGVHANIVDECELKNCFEVLSPKYDRLILERYVSGNGYRVYTVADRVVRCRKLEAAHVIGDGRSTVKQLVDLENKNPLRSRVNSTLKKIVLDDEAVRVLKKQNLTLDSIPKIDQRVKLVEVTNLSRGGTSFDFLGDLHPENIDLCIEVANTMRLFCSGIDLISPDASQPWHENGAVICEVNAQPQIGIERVQLHDDLILMYAKEFPDISLSISNTNPTNPMPIFNKSLKSINLDLHPQLVLRNGCPTQYFSSLHIANDVSKQDRVRLEKMLVSIEPGLSS